MEMIAQSGRAVGVLGEAQQVGGSNPSHTPNL